MHGSPREPITYTVHATHDGRSFAARQVTASQAHGEIFTLSASFHRDESGLDHQQAMPAVPAPEATPTMAEQLAAAGEDPAKAWPAPGTIDLRPVPVPSGPDQACWMRADGPLPDDVLLHVAVLAYASDLNLLDAVLTRHRRSWEEPGFRGASLDHAMWFHRPFRADEWLLYAQRSPTAFGGRGLAVGEVWAADGRHVATVAQEGLLRFPG